MMTIQPQQRAALAAVIVASLMSGALAKDTKAVTGAGPPDDQEVGLLPSGLSMASGEGVTPPTGSMLVFSALVSNNWDVFSWDLDPTHQPTQITHTPYDESTPTIAPDHSYCVYETVDGKLWRIALDKNTPPKQPHDPKSNPPVFSASPTRLPFASDQMFDMHPAISPNGKQIAMATSLDRISDDCDLIVFDTRAARFGRRLEMLSYQHYPGWAPDGKHLAFAHLHGRLQTGRPIYEIWVMRVDMPWARQLTLLDAVAISPSWSPAGDAVTFACNRHGQFDIWLVDPVTRAYSRLTEHKAADTDPVFSRDGRWIMFVSTRDGQPGLWKLNRHTRKVTPVTPFGPDLRVPCKDPDWK